MDKSKWKGLTPRKTSIRVFFMFNGNEYHESLKIPSTPANMDYAATMRKEMLRRIDAGTFKFEDYFPDSKNAKKEDEKQITLPLFKDVVKDYLDFKKMGSVGLGGRVATRSLAPTTIKTYEKTINTHFIGPFGEKIMADISFDEVVAVMSALKIRNKTFNNILSILNGVFTYAAKHKSKTGVLENLCEEIEFVENETTKPDPLEPWEVDLILKDMKEFYDEQIVNYFDLAFRIGFRPSEGIDLRWANVDWNKQTILINSSCVWGIKKGVKTGKERFVELDDECMAILQRMKKYTFMKFEEIFIYPATGRPYFDNSNLVQKYLRPTLKRCGIRDRNAHQTRHTCATLMLMGKCDEKWAARQLGHSVDMFRTRYSTWMPEIDQRRELSKLSAMFKPAEKSIESGVQL